MKVAVIVHNGEFRVHKNGCGDVAKEAKRYHDTPWIFDAADQHEVNLTCWGDVASDTTESGSQEWAKLCDEYASAETTYLPCAKELPEAADHATEEKTMTRVILLTPGQRPKWLPLPPSFEPHEREKAVRNALELEEGEFFESMGSSNGWIAYGGELAKEQGDAVNTAYLPLFQSIGGSPFDLVAGPVLLVGVGTSSEEETPREELREVFGDLWPTE